MLIYCLFQPLRDCVHQTLIRHYKEARFTFGEFPKSLAEGQEPPSSTFWRQEAGSLARLEKNDVEGKQKLRKSDQINFVLSGLPLEADCPMPAGSAPSPFHSSSAPSSAVVLLTLSPLSCLLVTAPRHICITPSELPDEKVHALVLMTGMM